MSALLDSPSQSRSFSVRLITAIGQMKDPNTTPPTNATTTTTTVNNDDVVKTTIQNHVKPLQDLLKYLSDHGTEICKGSKELTEFETLTATTLLTYDDDPILLKILKDCGWTGYRYLENDDIPLDVDYCKQSLSNYYLKTFHHVMNYNSSTAGMVAAATGASSKGINNGNGNGESNRAHSVKGMLIAQQSDGSSAGGASSSSIASPLSATGIAGSTVATSLTTTTTLGSRGTSNSRNNSNSQSQSRSGKSKNHSKAAFLAEHILPLCPDMLIRAMELDVLAANQPACIYFYGACVLADMSGFSKFSGEMCSKGVEGLDELRATTSGFLGDLVDTVYKYKGDVIAFAGDALICVFPGCTPYLGSRSTEPYDFTPECCLRALLCACELSNYKNKNLSTHVGVSYGEMNLAMLGGYKKQWVYVLAGDCVSELSSCVPDAGPQEVCCTNRCLLKMESTDEFKQDKITTLSKVCTASNNVKIKIELANRQLVPGNDSMVAINGDGDNNQQMVKTANVEEEFNGFELISEPTNLSIGSAVPGGSGSSNTNGTVYMKTLGYRQYIQDHVLIHLQRPSGHNHHHHHHSNSSQHHSSRNKHDSSAEALVPVANSQRAIQKQQQQAINQYYQKLIKTLGQFIPETVQHALLHSDSKAANMDIMGELRHVTTMFLSLDSYDKEKEGKDPLLLQRFLNFAQRRLVESGGFLRQFLVDDKGCVLIAMWGVPAFTYANNCTRGFYCAAAIALDALQEDFKVSIGVATGMVFCGCVGATSRYDYVGIGTDVNIAARLMSKAHGTVLLDPTTYRSLNKSSKNMVVEMEPLVLKGLKEPMKPYKYDVSTHMNLSTSASEDPMSDFGKSLLPQLNEPDERLGSNLLIRKTVAEALSRHLDQICLGQHRRLHDRDEEEEHDSSINNKSKSNEKGENNGNARIVDSEEKKKRNSLSYSRSTSDDIDPLVPTAVVKVRRSDDFSDIAKVNSVEDVEEDEEDDDDEEDSELAHNTNMNGSKKRSKKTKLMKPQQGISSVMFLLGAAGAGKSAACKYFRQSAHQRNIPCIIIQAHSSHRGVPYGVVRELFVNLIGRLSFVTGSKFGKKFIKMLVESAFEDILNNGNIDSSSSSGSGSTSANSSGKDLHNISARSGSSISFDGNSRNNAVVSGDLGESNIAKKKEKKRRKRERREKRLSLKPNPPKVQMFNDPVAALIASSDGSASNDVAMGISGSNSSSFVGSSNVGGVAESKDTDKGHAVLNGESESSSDSSDDCDDEDDDDENLLDLHIAQQKKRQERELLESYCQHLEKILGLQFQENEIPGGMPSAGEKDETKDNSVTSLMPVQISNKAASIKTLRSATSSTNSIIDPNATVPTSSPTRTTPIDHSSFGMVRTTTPTDTVGATGESTNQVNAAVADEQFENFSSRENSCQEDANSKFDRRGILQKQDSSSSVVLNSNLLNRSPLPDYSNYYNPARFFFHFVRGSNNKDNSDNQNIKQAQTQETTAVSSTKSLQQGKNANGRMGGMNKSKSVQFAEHTTVTAYAMITNPTPDTYDAGSEYEQFLMFNNLERDRSDSSARPNEAVDATSSVLPSTASNIIHESSSNISEVKGIAMKKLKEDDECVDHDMGVDADVNENESELSNTITSKGERRDAGGLFLESPIKPMSSLQISDESPMAPRPPNASHGSGSHGVHGIPLPPTRNGTRPTLISHDSSNNDISASLSSSASTSKSKVNFHIPFFGSLGHGATMGTSANSDRLAFVTSHSANSPNDRKNSTNDLRNSLHREFSTRELDLTPSRSNSGSPIPTIFEASRSSGGNDTPPSGIASSSDYQNDHVGNGIVLRRDSNTSDTSNNSFGSNPVEGKENIKEKAKPQGGVNKWFLSSPGASRNTSTASTGLFTESSTSSVSNIVPERDVSAPDTIGIAMNATSTSDRLIPLAPKLSVENMNVGNLGMSHKAPPVLPITLSSESLNEQNKSSLVPTPQPSPSGKDKKITSKFNFFGRRLMLSRSNSASKPNIDSANKNTVANVAAAVMAANKKDSPSANARVKNSQNNTSNNSLGFSGDEGIPSLSTSDDRLLSSNSDDTLLLISQQNQQRHTNSKQELHQTSSNSLGTASSASSSATPASQSTPMSPIMKSLKRCDTAKRLQDIKMEEYVFHQVLKYLLKDSPQAIVIENGHLCDELSWRMIQGLVEDPDIDVAILVTILLKGYLAESDKEALPSHNRDRKSLDPSSTSHSHSQSHHVAHSTSNAVLTTEIPLVEDNGVNFSTSTHNPTVLGNGASTVSEINSVTVSTAEGSSDIIGHKRGFFTRNPYQASQVAQQNPPGNTNKQPTGSAASMMPAVSTSGSITSASTSTFAMGSHSLHGSQSWASTSIAIKAKISKKLQQDVAAAGLVVMNQSYSEILELGGLDRDEVKEILKFSLKVDDVSDELADLVVNVSSGNPFWCRSIATFIKDRGLEEFEQVTTAAANKNVLQPMTSSQKHRQLVQNNDPREMLKALIVCRMEKLITQPEDQMILRYASIIGQVFTAKLLYSILPFRLESKVLLQSLGSLVGHGFLLCLEESPDHKFGFQNPLIQSVIYSLTTPSDAAHVHRSIAEYIEVTFCDNLRPYYPSLGYHYRHCTDMHDLAFKYEIKSADQAIGQGAYNDGLEFLHTALKYANHKVELRLLLELIAIAKEDIQEAIRNQSYAYSHGHGHGHGHGSSSSFVPHHSPVVSYHFARWTDKNIIEYDKLKRLVEIKYQQKMKYSRSRFFLNNGNNSMLGAFSSGSSEDIGGLSGGLLGFGLITGAGSNIGTNNGGVNGGSSQRPELAWQPSYVNQKRLSIERRREQAAATPSVPMYQNGYVMKKIKARREARRRKSEEARRSSLISTTGVDGLDDEEEYQARLSSGQVSIRDSEYEIDDESRYSTSQFNSTTECCFLS